MWPARQLGGIPITFDARKRQATLGERNLDFADAALMFAGDTVEAIDDRRDHGETRIVTVGRLRGRVVIAVGTERDGARHVMSMRKPNEREQRLHRQRLGEG